MLSRFHPLALFLVAAGLAASLAALVLRHQAEARSRAVALVLDSDELRAFAAETGVPTPQALRRFRSAGITGVAVTEETLGDLRARGMVTVAVRRSPSRRSFVLSFADAELASRVETAMRRLARFAERPDQLLEEAGDLVEIAGRGGAAGRPEDFGALPVGLDPRSTAEIRDAGLTPVARLNNPIGLSAANLDAYLGQAKEHGATTVIFAGDEVLGYRGLIPRAAEAFRKLGLSYGSVEFGKQRGDEALAELLQDRLVRVHSISAAEMARLAPAEAIERYVRAAAERNIRLCYVRLPGVVTERTFDDATAYVRSLARAMAAAGFGLSEPVPLGWVWPDPGARRAAAAAAGLGVGGACLLLLATLVPVTRGRQALLALLFGAAGAAAAALGGTRGLQADALLAAIVFPSLAFTLFPQPVGAFEEHRHALVRERSEAPVAAWAEFAAMSAVTLAGGVLVAGLLSELPFMVKVRAFAGIKLSAVAPILLVGWFYLTGMTGAYPSWREERDAVAKRLRRFLSEPLRVWHTAAILLGIAALALLVARSGNDSGIGASDLELRLRALLDRFLGARPRFKEFALGHPALVLGLAMAAVPKSRRWALPLLLVGAIGQSGMLNSFCHLHTPLKVTLLRTFNGLWAGSVLGLALAVAWQLAQGGGIRPRKAPRGAG